LLFDCFFKAPLRCEIRLYDLLFKSREPMAVKGDWLEDLNPQSLVRF